MKKVLIKYVKILLIIFAVFSIMAITGNAIAHNIVFKRANYNEYNTDNYLTYDDLNKDKYPREELKIQSGDNKLTGFWYGKDNTKGLVIISPGHRDCNDIKLYETIYFVDNGWHQDLIHQ